MDTRKSYGFGMNKPPKLENINWSDKDRMINRTLAQTSVMDFIALSELTEDAYFKMLASDLAHPGKPSVNLQRVYHSLKMMHSLRKVDGEWYLRNGQWIGFTQKGKEL